MIKKWKYLFATQFLGVFNDNLLKILICFVGALWVDEESRSNVIPLAGALLVVPFILFSPLAGKLSVIKSKRKIVEIAKLMEIPIMVIAVGGFIFESITLVMVALSFMGLQSALFSPSKYGLIRDIGGLDGLSYGAGSMEMLSFIGVLIGTVVAGLISDIEEVRLLVIGGSLLITAVIGWISSRSIKVTEPAVDSTFQGSINPIIFLWKNFKWAKSIQGLNTTILGLGTFWLVGALLHMNIMAHCPQVLGLSNSATSFVMAIIAIGIGLGCYVSGLLAKNIVELGIVPIGGFGLSICMSFIAFKDLGNTSFIIMLFFGAFFSGLYKVPLSAWIQERVEGRKLGDILAYNNLVVFIFILISSVLFSIIESNLGTQAVFVAVAVISWLITIITMTKIPAMMLRFILYILSHTFFRIKLEGAENIPKKTGALIVTNHLSLMDSLLVVAAVPRMVRFVVHQKVYEHPMLFWWFKHLSIIPILPQGGPKALEAFNKTCQDEINKGHVVCIFPEGKISRTGQLNEFKKGIEHIAKGIDAPIIPMHMDNVIGSAFSYYPGSSVLFKFRRSTLKRSVSIKVGNPMPKDTSAFILRQRVIELSADIFANRIKENHTLVHLFIQKARKNPDSLFSFDENGHVITYKHALNDVLFIATKLKDQLKNEQVIAFSGESSYLSAIYNLSLNLLGKSVINLDSGNADCEDLVLNKSDVVICSRHQKEQFSTTIRCIEIIEPDKNFKSNMIRDAHALVHQFNPKMNRDQIATIIFYKSEKGQIKEVHLSQKNILSNVLGLRQVHQLKEDDSILCKLDFSSALGYTTNLWLPACLGLPAIWVDSNHNIPYQPTIVIGWEDQIEEVIQNHLNHEPLNRVKHVITGHISISKEKEDWIKKHWNTEIRYGFGIPECGPVISINCPDYDIPDLSGKKMVNQGTVEGTVGRSLPGVAVKIIDKETHAELGPDEIGQILVKGPNVISESSASRETEFRDGWLVTQYTGAISSKGFLTLKGPESVIV